MDLVSKIFAGLLVLGLVAFIGWIIWDAATSSGIGWDD